MCQPPCGATTGEPIKTSGKVSVNITHSLGSLQKNKNSNMTFLSIQLNQIWLQLVLFCLHIPQAGHVTSQNRAFLGEYTVTGLTVRSTTGVSETDGKSEPPNVLEDTGGHYWYTRWKKWSLGNILKIYSHKMNNLKSVFYCYFYQLTYQNTKFMHYWKDWSSFSVVFITPYLMHHSVILWNSPSMHSVNKWNTAYSCNVLTSLLNKQKK